MFVPRPFQSDNFEQITAVVDRHALATAVSFGDPLPFVTHLPVIRVLPADAERTLIGSTMLGHLNNKNPHWSTLSDNDPMLLVFQGPSSYVTPSIYAQHPVAPTWNFVSVHVRGRITLREPGEPTLDVICRTVERYEQTLGTGWDMTESMGYFRRIVPSVGAFDFEVEAVDSQFKLSQDQPPELRERVIADFAQKPDLQCSGLVELMRSVQS